MESLQHNGETTVARAMLESADDTDAPITPLISQAVFLKISFYYTCISIPICLFGIFTNIIDILVFYKIGFSSPSTISLFCLAISDSLILLYIMLTSIAYHPAVVKADLTIAMRDVTRAAAMTYYCFCALSSWITAIINAERSCCVAFPMKVRRIFTPMTIICLIGGMLIYQIVLFLPRGFAIGYTWTISPLNNRTIIRFNVFKPEITSVVYLASYTVPNLICFFSVAFGTIFLISKFKQSRKFRDSMTGSGKGSDKLSDKDIRLVRSMIFICVIYIVGTTPGAMYFIASTAYPPIYIDDPYLGNLGAVFIAIGNFFQTISCSVNIFVYLRMGSNFKQTFMEMFSLQSKESTDKR